MAVPTGTFKTFEQVGIKEELAEIIYDVSPDETPFLNSIMHDEAENTLFEWQTDALAAADKTGALEGDDAPQDTSSPTVRLNNRTHIKTRDARVSGTGRSVNAAGRGDELEYQMLRRGVEIRNDMEAILLDNNAKVAGGAAVARETAGIVSWLATNTDAASDGVDPTGDGTDIATDGTQRAFTEDQLKDVLRQCFASGGKPNTIMVGPFNRQIFSSFSAGRTNVQQVKDSVLRASFDVYASDFGQLRVVPNLFQRDRDALILQLDMWAVSFLPGRNMTSFPLAKTGDSDARQVVSEFGLKAKNEKASGVVRDLTTS